MRIFTICSLLLLASSALAQAPTSTPTPFSAKRFTNCHVLSDSSATFVGSTSNRVDVVYWAETGPIFCAYPTGTPTVGSAQKTPGSGWTKLNTGFGVHLCDFQDQPLACFGSGGIVCFDEGRMTSQ